MRLLLPVTFILLLPTLPCIAKLIPIGAIQGVSHESPYLEKTVSVQGVVTRIYKNGFVIQTTNPDDNPSTSEAIYINKKNHELDQGNQVEVHGVVKERVPGKTSDNNLTSTEVSAKSVKLLNASVALPKPIELNRIAPSFPNQIKEAGSEFDPERNAMDLWETMEHMTIVLRNGIVVGPTTRYKEFAIRIPEQDKLILTNKGGVKLQGYSNPALKLLIAPTQSNIPHLETGDTLNNPIYGTVTYSFGQYKISATSDIYKASRDTPTQASLPHIPEASFKVATFNVENLYPKLGDPKYNKLASIIVNNLQSPDILGLQEIQDNNGPGADKAEVVDASKTIELLLTAIEKAGGPQYKYTQINPKHKADGGWPGGNIRNVFFYKEDKVSLIKSYLFEDEVFNYNNEKDYGATRKPLVALFKVGDHNLAVINCHLKSKVGDNSAYGSIQPYIRNSDFQRIKQTKAIVQHMAELRSISPSVEFIVLGDMNDYEFSESIGQFTDAGSLVNMIGSAPLSQSYTYIYQGMSQILDHILISESLEKSAHIHIPHINADFSNESRASDHDPIVVWWE